MNLSKKEKKLAPNTVIIISSIGGGLEVYDFSIYIFFALLLSVLFFPTKNNTSSLILTFAVFTIGYLSRPLGAILFGHYSDRFGRKSMMLISLTIMAISSCLIALLPTYALIGILAPIALTLLRLIQGIGIGGDIPGAITFVAEHSSNENRGLACSFIFCALNLGLLLASSISALLTSLLSSESLMAWGWQLAFLIGVLFALASFSVLSSGIVGAVPSTLSEIFSTHVRSTGIGLSYNFGFAIFAGTTPMLVTFLLYILKFQEAPFINLAIAAFFCLISIFSIKESSQENLLFIS